MKSASFTYPIVASKEADFTSNSNEGVKIILTDAAAAAKEAAAPTAPSSKKRGPQLLLCSIAGATTAAGITISRWLLLETGEVLLLFANDERVCQENDSGYASEIMTGIDPDFAMDYSLQCTDNNEHNATLGSSMGEILLTIASSPYLRSAPLLLLFLSSTAFVVGVILTHNDFRQCWSWVQTCQEYGEECSQQLITVMGVSNTDELSVRLKEKHSHLKNALWKQVEKSVDCIDGLVLDDILQQWIRAGVDFTMGAWGGIVLYSLPEEIFERSLNGSSGTRRRLIHAADPSLEKVIFSPGGLWDVLPPHMRDSLVRRRLIEEIKPEVEVMARAGCHEGTETISMGSTDNDEDSSDTPLAYPMQSTNRMSSSEDSVPIHYAQIIRAEGGKKNPGSRETVPDALCGTINDLIVSNFMGTRRLSRENEQKSSQSNGDNNGEQHNQQHEECRHEQQSEPIPPPPKLKLEVFLRRTSTVATFIFLCHLRSSPSTRRAWGSAAKILTSVSLISAAIGTGVASTLLSSNAPAVDTMTTNPIIRMFYSKILDGLRAPQVSARISRMQSMLTWLREEIRKNKQLQTALAFMVLYRMRRKGCLRSQQD